MELLWFETATRGWSLLRVVGKCFPTRLHLTYRSDMEVDTNNLYISLHVFNFLTDLFDLGWLLLLVTHDRNVWEGCGEGKYVQTAATAAHLAEPIGKTSA